MKEYVFAFFSACAFFFVGYACSIVIVSIIVSMAWIQNSFVYIILYFAFILVISPLVGGYCSYFLTKKYFYVMSGFLVAVLCSVASLVVLRIVIEMYEIIMNVPLRKRGDYHVSLTIMAVPAVVGILLAALVSASGPAKPSRPIIPF